MLYCMEIDGLTYPAACEIMKTCADVHDVSEDISFKFSREVRTVLSNLNIDKFITRLELDQLRRLS